MPVWGTSYTFILHSNLSDKCYNPHITDLKVKVRWYWNSHVHGRNVEQNLNTKSGLYDSQTLALYTTW